MYPFKSRRGKLAAGIYAAVAHYSNWSPTQLFDLKYCNSLTFGALDTVRQYAEPDCDDGRREQEKAQRESYQPRLTMSGGCSRWIDFHDWRIVRTHGVYVIQRWDA